MMLQNNDMARVTRRRSRRDRRRREGMTLVEIMIVVIIMALIAGAVAVAVVPKLGQAKEHTAQTNVSTIKQGAINYILSGGDGCPTVDDLIEARELDEDADPLDPWDHEYDVACNGDNVVVTSAGADGQFETEDDITTARRRQE